MRTGVIGVCLTAAALTAGFAVSGSAAPGGATGGGQAARPLRMFLSGQLGRLMTLRSELGVTDEQREQIKQIVQSHRAEIVAVAKPLSEKRRALRDATLTANADEQAIRAAADGLGDAIGDAAVLGSKIKAEVAKIMTPEQREKIDAFRHEADAAVDKFMQDAASAS